MSKFSVIFPSMFLLGSFFLIPPTLQAWNPDYAYGLPRQRRMCVVREKGNQVHFKAIFSNEDCPLESKRYIVVFAKEPRGAIALLRSTTSQKFYPPLTLKWPTDQNPSRTTLWHFTCVKLEEKEVLGSKLSLYKYLGEFTVQSKYECRKAEARALKYCQNNLKGETLLEACPIPWGS